MKCKTIAMSVLTASVACWLAVQTSMPAHARPNSSPQNTKAQSSNTPSDPLKSLTNSFPRSVRARQNGHLLEFCPDNTCDGFVSSQSVPVAELKYFAYLYIYFFSDFVYLPGWRTQPEAKKVADQILSRPEFGKCKSQSDLEKARCVLLDRSQGGRIKLIFVRYDEGQRNVVPEDIRAELSQKPLSTR